MFNANKCPACIIAVMGKPDGDVVSDADHLVGRLLHLATLQAPELTKAWYSLAGCCYKWGHKAVDNAM